MAGVVLDGVSKVYPDGTRAVSNLDLDIEDGEFMVLVGPSGCGKTTALRMVAGLEDISEGEVRIGDRVVNHVPPKDRDIAMVFQSYALYPHLSVFENIAFGLRLRKMAKDEVRTRVERAARILGLEDLLGRKPRALSGGQRQRVGLSRAVLKEAPILVLDDCLSAVDTSTEARILSGLRPVMKDRTTIVISHRVAAVKAADLIIVLEDGTAVSYTHLRAHET